MQANKSPRRHALAAPSGTGPEYLESRRMDRGLAVLLTAIVGGVLALQAPINAGLGRATGQLPAALVSFTVGTVVLAVIVGLSGEWSGLSSTFEVRWYYLIGGVLGAAYVTMALIAVKSIGAGGGDRPARDPGTRANADHRIARRGHRAAARWDFSAGSLVQAAARSLAIRPALGLAASSRA